MADDVQIQIGATTDKLGSDIDEAKGKIESIGSSVDSVTEAGKRLAEIFGIAFTIEGIKSFVESMAELGLQTERTMAMLGANADQVVMMSGIAKLTGMDMSGLAMSIERMSLNVQRSTRDAFNPAAQALGVLGLKAKDLIGTPTSEYLDKLHDAISRFNPSLNLTNALMALGGRYFAQAIPLLTLTGQEWDEFKQQVLKANEGLAAAIPGMAGTHQRLTLLGESVTSLGARIFSVLKPAIDGAIILITNWVQSMDTEKIKAFATSAVDSIQYAVVAIGAFFIGAGTTVDDFIAKLDLSLGKIKLIASIAAGFAAGGVLGSAIPGAGTAVGALAGGVTGAIVYASSGADAIQHSVKRINDSFDDLNQSTVVGKINSYFDTIKAAIEKGTAATSGIAGQSIGDDPNKKDASAIDEGVKQKLDAQSAAIDGSIKLWEGWLTQQKEIYKVDAAQFKISQGQRFDNEINDLNEAYTNERLFLEEKKRLWASEPTEYAKVLASLKELDQKFTTDTIKLQAQQTQAIEKDWDSVIKPIQSAWNSQLRGLLSGTETFSQAMKKITADLVIAMIEKFEELAIIKPMIQALSSAFDIASLLDSVIGMIKALIGPIFAGMVAFLAPKLGPIAIPVSAALAAGVGAMAGSKGFETGAWEIPARMTANLHPGEMVVPAEPAGAIRNFAQGAGASGGGGLGGDTHVHFNVNAMDASSVQRFFTQNGNQIAKSIQATQARTPSMSW